MGLGWCFLCDLEWGRTLSHPGEVSPRYFMILLIWLQNYDRVKWNKIGCGIYLSKLLLGNGNCSLRVRILFPYWSLDSLAFGSGSWIPDHVTVHSKGFLIGSYFLIRILVIFYVDLHISSQTPSLFLKYTHLAFLMTAINILWYFLKYVPCISCHLAISHSSHFCELVSVQYVSFGGRSVQGTWSEGDGSAVCWG